MRPRDEGAAAVELALLLGVLLTLVGLVGPVSYLFYERVQLGRTAGDVVRFATSRADQVRTYPGGTVAVGALPSAGAVSAEAGRAHTGRNAATATLASSTDNSCPSTRRRTVTVTTTASLGPFIGLFTPDDTNTLVATATSCEE